MDFLDINDEYQCMLMYDVRCMIFVCKMDYSATCSIWRNKRNKKKIPKCLAPLKKKGAMYIELKFLNIYEALRFPCDHLGLHR